MLTTFRLVAVPVGNVKASSPTFVTLPTTLLVIDEPECIALSKNLSWLVALLIILPPLKVSFVDTVTESFRVTLPEPVFSINIFGIMIGCVPSCSIMPLALPLKITLSVNVIPAVEFKVRF